MSLTTENLARISAVSDIHTKFLRAINAGSKRTFHEFRKKHGMQGTGFVSNHVDPEKPDERNLKFSTEAIIKNRKDGVGLSLSMSVRDSPENCGVVLSVFAHNKASGEGRFCLNLMCTLTTEFRERWYITVNGEWPTLIGDLGTLFQETMTEDIPEADALKYIKDLVREHEKYLWPTRQRV